MDSLGIDKINFLWYHGYIMFKIIIGIVIGILICDLNFTSGILTFFNESGLNDLTIETLEGLK